MTLHYWTAILCPSRPAPSGSLSRPCPACGAQVGVQCRDELGARESHPERCGTRRAALSDEAREERRPIPVDVLLGTVAESPRPTSGRLLKSFLIVVEGEGRRS